MNPEFSLTVGFCVTNETDLLLNAFSKIKGTNCADEFVFVLSRNCSEESKKTVESICMSNDICKFFYQDSFGLGNAIKKIIDVSTASHLIVWPADDGMDSSSFPSMVECAKENPNEIIKVSRWLRKGDFENYNKMRYLINKISQKMFSLLYHSKLTDFTNPTQIAPLKVYRSIDFKNDDFSFIPEMVFKPLINNVEFIEIPCKNTEKRTGKSNGNFLSLAKYYLVIIKIYFEQFER